MYITNPFTEKTVNDGHQNTRQAREIARLIGTFGYNVDVLRYNAKFAVLKKSRSIVK